MAGRVRARGNCGYCGRELTARGLIGHLRSCTARRKAIEEANRGGRSVQDIHHLRVPGRYRQEYRLHLEMCGSTTLEELDHYLRTIWLGSGEVLLCAQGLYNSSAMTSIYAWDPDKNAKLSTERRLSFEQIIAEIEMHGVLDDVENPNPAFPRQRVLFVAVDGYAVAVPYLTDGETKFLKTAFHSRRATRIYLGG